MNIRRSLYLGVICIPLLFGFTKSSNLDIYGLEKTKDDSIVIYDGNKIYSSHYIVPSYNLMKSYENEEYLDVDGNKILEMGDFVYYMKTYTKLAKSVMFEGNTINIELKDYLPISKIEDKSIQEKIINFFKATKMYNEDTDTTTLHYTDIENNEYDVEVSDYE